MMANQFVNSSPQTDLTNRVGDLERSLSYLHDHVKSQDKHISKCIKNEKETAALLLKLQRDHSDLVKYMGVLEEYCLELDVKSRKRHLILTGIEETEAEKNHGKNHAPEDNGAEMETDESNFDPTHTLAFSTLQTICESIAYQDIDVAYRLGKCGPSPRPILIKSVREHINFRESDETKTAFLNDDLPTKVNQQRAELRCIVNHAKSKNVYAKTLGDKISVDNKIYSYRDIDRLPQGLKISEAKMIDTPRGIAFQSQYAFLSNFYPAPVKYNGIQFPTSEHCYQYNRVTFFGNQDAAYSARTAVSPQKAKQACARLPNSKEWDYTKYDKMKEIAFPKFAQNPSLRIKLLETGDRPLLEASYDSFWGCGYNLSARKLLQGEWQGKNYLGQILVECRNEIIREKAASGSKQPTQGQSVNQPPTQQHTYNQQGVNSRHSKSPASRAMGKQNPQQGSTGYHGLSSNSTQHAAPRNQLSGSINYQDQQPLTWPMNMNMMYQQPSYPMPPPFYMYPPMPMPSGNNMQQQQLQSMPI